MSTQIRYKDAPKAVLKVLARKARFLSRKNKVEEMLYGLTCIAVTRNHVDRKEIGAIERILRNAQKARA